MPRGGARAAQQLAAKMGQGKSKKGKSMGSNTGLSESEETLNVRNLIDFFSDANDHVHENASNKLQPHFPEGVKAGQWEAKVESFRSQNLQMVADPEVVKRWSEVEVAAWVACIAKSTLAQYSDSFMRNHITGVILMELGQHHLDQIGVDRISDQLKMWEIVEQMQRRCKKTDTQSIQVPPWHVCFLEQVTFAWANTSEGKTGGDMVEEVVSANGSIALVATLVWTMAWDQFMGSATVCYCPADGDGVWQIDEMDYCFCSTAWDMDKWPLACFYLFSGLSTVFFMCSTIYAVIQILMVYEMSDSPEVEAMMDLLGSQAQLPGQFLFVGMLLFCVPIALYLVFTINLGIGLDKGAEFGDVFVGPKFDEQKILSWISGISALALTLFGFCWQMPALISAVYVAKKNAVMDDNVELFADGKHRKQVSK